MDLVSWYGVLKHWTQGDAQLLEGSPAMHGGGLKESLLIGLTFSLKNSHDSSLIEAEGLNETPK